MATSNDTNIPFLCGFDFNKFVFGVVTTFIIYSLNI